MKFLILCSIFMNMSFAQVVKEGEKFPETFNFKEEKLVLNGLGLRLATWFEVKVYIGALYLTSKSHDANNILNSKSPKVIQLKFLRDVEKEKIIGAWNEGIKNPLFSTELLKLNSMMEDMKKKSSMTLLLEQNQVEVRINGKSKGLINKPGFATAITSIYLGSNPPNEKLKTGMLGK